MNKISNGKAQFLVRTSGGLDYCRVEPWEGGQPAAESGAQRIGGYVVALDESLCVATDGTGDPLIVADYRVQALEVTRAQLAEAHRAGHSRGTDPINHQLPDRDAYDAVEVIVPAGFATEPLRSEYLKGFDQGWIEYFNEVDR